MTEEQTQEGHQRLPRVEMLRRFRPLDPHPLEQKTEVAVLLAVVAVLAAGVAVVLAQAPRLNLNLLLAVNHFVATHRRVASVDGVMAQQFIVALSATLATAVAALAWRRRGRRLLAITLTLAGAQLLNLALASGVPEPRPFTSSSSVHRLIAHGPGQSFPSDHATAAFAAAVAAALFIHARLGAALAVGAALVGIARVGAGVHYPADILAGGACALGAGSLALLLSRTAPGADRLDVGEEDKLLPPGSTSLSVKPGTYPPTFRG